MPERFKFPDDSRLDSSTVVTIDDKANYTARLDLKLSGLFLNSALRTDDEKKSAINSILSKLLPDAELGKFTVTSLSDDLFAVNAEAKSTKPLQSTGGEYLFTLPQDAPWTSRFEFPMGRSQRKTTLRLVGPFEQNINLEIKLPDGWSASAVPKEITHDLGTIASVSEHAENGKGRVTLTSTIAIRQRDLPPESYMQVRSALAEIQTERVRTIILSPSSKKSASEKSM